MSGATPPCHDCVNGIGGVFLCGACFSPLCVHCAKEAEARNGVCLDCFEQVVRTSLGEPDAVIPLTIV